MNQCLLEMRHQQGRLNTLLLQVVVALKMPLHTKHQAVAVQAACWLAQLI
jgi:hypothetical protein